MRRLVGTLPQARANDLLAFGADARRDEQPGITPRTLVEILATGACYYLATQAAWVLCFPDSKVSLVFPPHAVLVAILLLVPTRHWWAYALTAACVHFVATQQARWPPLYALECEAFDAVKNVLAAGGIRLLIKSPLDRISLRDAIIFVLIAGVVVPFGTAFWGAAFTVSNHFGTDYWVEWRNLGVSNGVTAIVLVPAILVGIRQVVMRELGISRERALEAGVLAAGVFAVGWLAFHRSPAGPNASPALLYAPIPLLIWAALRFGPGGVGTAMLGISVLAISGTMRGLGPFQTQTPAENALALQLFLLVAAVPLMLLGVAIDEERRSQQELRVGEERMSLALDSAQMAVWDWDVTKDTVWMAREGRKLFGFEPDEPLRYASLAGRVHPDDSRVRATAIQHALTTGGSYEAEYRILLPDGSERWIAARGHLASPATPDAAQRIIGVSMDVTRQKQASGEARAQREELAHLSRVVTLSTLSSSLAHELSQPLTCMLSNASAGERFMAQDTPDQVEARAIFADIVGAGRRAREIIEAMRTMLRGGEVTLAPVNVKQSLEELLRLIRADLIGRGVSVSNLATEELPPAMTNRVQLQQVLLNLIVNACDAMASNAPGDRTLTLTTVLAQNELRIGVLDCGVGLPDDLDALWQPFRSTKDGGLGMGLSICRTLVTSHGGKLWAEHRPGRGAAFHVALPLAAGTTGSSGRADSTAIGGGA